MSDTGLFSFSNSIEDAHIENLFTGLNYVEVQFLSTGTLTMREAMRAETHTIYSLFNQMDQNVLAS